MRNWLKAYWHAYKIRRSISATRYGRVIVLLLLFVLTGLSPLSYADEAPVLTVFGAGSEPLKLSLDDIKAMGQTELSTTTPWTDGTQHFVGVTGAQFVKSIKAGGASATALAANDYQVTIPWAVLASPSTLIAYGRNGQPMNVRDKGPLWIVFPFDSDPEFLTATYKSYSVWSLISVDFR